MTGSYKPGLIAIDANSLGYYHHNGARLRAGKKEVQAIFGFIRALSDYCARYPNHMVVVLWDGHAQWRYDLLPETADHCGYKGGRDDDPKQAAMRQAYREIRPEIQEACRLLGIRQISCPTAEADDLAKLLIDQSEKKGCHNVVVTGDGDWLQLVSNLTELYNIRTTDRVRLSNFKALTGYESPRAFVEGKCLMGDTSDKVPGVGKIGEARAAEVLAEFGSIANLLKRGRSEDISKWPKYLRDFVTDAKGGLAILKRNLKLMDLSRTVRPDPNSIVVDHGTPDLAALRAFFEERRFESFLLGFHGFVRVFPAYRNITEVAV